MKIGIMGGTFNPIHTGHLLLAKAAMEQAGLEGVMFLPSGISYLKRDTGVLEAAHRMKMVELAVAGNPAFFASDMEITRAGNTYTCDTLLQLKKEHPGDSYFFIVGADCLFSIERWKNPQCIFDNCTLLAAARDGAALSRLQEQCSHLRARFHGQVRLLAFAETPLSSTDIRRLVSAGGDIRHMVPEAVRQYIEEHGLYRTLE